MSLYEILDLPQTASPEDIRISFRKLARQFHPDVNDDPEAGDRFRLVYIAYDILHDKNKRSLYDELLVLREAESRFSHEADIRAWVRHAGREAQDYSEMTYQEFDKTFLARLRFHSSQVFAFILFFLLLCLGSMALMTGMHYVVQMRFNGHILFGGMLAIFGLGFAWFAARAIWDILVVWRE